MTRRLSALLLFFLLGAFSSWALAGELITRWASGEVVATDTEAVPNTIVVKTKNWKGQDFIVGAAVEADTVIKIRGRTATLRDIKVGDIVDIVYVRNKRVIAKSIKVKK